MGQRYNNLFRVFSLIGFSISELLVGSYLCNSGSQKKRFYNFKSIKVLRSSFSFCSRKYFLCQGLPLL